MLRLHWDHGGHGGPVCAKRGVPWGLGHFLPIVHVELRLVKFRQGVLRYQ